MNFKPKLLLLLFVTALSLFLVSGLKAVALDPFEKVCTGNADNPNSPASSSVCRENKKALLNDDATNNVVVRILNSATTIVMILVGIGAVVVIILSGFSLITSSGNSEQVATSRRRIIYALVGVAIAALAWAITRFVIANFIIE